MGITIFTDGSSRGNPGPGGWGALVITNYERQITNEDTRTTKVIELGGRDDHTTNNRMELTAAIESLRMVHSRKLLGDIELHTDSAYVLNGITKWVYGWEKNNWLTKEGEPVLNQDLWSALIEIARQLKLTQDIIWRKVEGHAGIRGNERVDEIATEFADKKLVLLFSGGLSDYEKMLGSDVFHTVTGSVPKKKTKTGQAYSYVSCVTGKIHIDKTWAECEKRVKGKKDVRFKKVFSQEEEADLIREFSKGR